MMDDKPNPSAPSSAYQAMAPHFAMVNTILGGAPAMRAAGKAYLPKFENETERDYKHRLAHAPFTNIYADISRNLASKPFAKELRLADGAPDVFIGVKDAAGGRSGGLVDDIDGQGNSLHVFSAPVFKAGVDKAMSWIMVDFTRAGQNADGRPLTRADEQAQGLRPYWVHLGPEQVIAAYSAFVGGVETLVHVRILEVTAVRDGFSERQARRVRVIDREVVSEASDGSPAALGPATWALWEEREIKGEKTWVEIDQGGYSIGVIPLVWFIPGGRSGATFQAESPLRDIAFLQVEEFQQESNLKHIKALTAFPMLAGNGVDGVMEDGSRAVVPVGPQAVLFAPPGDGGQHGEWSFIEPASTSLTFLKDDLSELRKEMRDLGMQPLTEGNLTVTTTKSVTQKASSQVQAWAILFKDTIDRALALTSMWLGIPDETECVIHLDFAIETEEGAQVDALLKAEAQSIISKRTVAEEMKRRGILSDQFDCDQEDERLADQNSGLDPEEGIDPITGMPLSASGANANPADAGGAPGRMA